MFLEKYAVRANIKARFRKFNIIAAIVLGIIWARHNLKKKEWLKAGLKIGGSGIGAFVFNRILYGRDKSAAAIMNSKAKNFGRWFKGVAR